MANRELRVRRHSNAREFLDRAEAWLLRSEVENGLVLGLARGLLKDDSRYGQPIYLATIEQNEEVLGCAFRTPPYPVALSLLPAESVERVAEAVRHVYDSIPGVIGPTSEATSFADVWTASSGESWSTRFQLRIHALREVRFPDSNPAGLLRKATESEIEFANHWGEGFVRDAGTQELAAHFGSRLIGDGRLYFWDDDGPRCMVASARETPNVAWVNTVYTPPEFRGRGYATVAVATLSQLLLEEGHAFCALYTDLANPSSNAIYRRVGYEPVRDDAQLEFSTP